MFHVWADTSAAVHKLESINWRGKRRRRLAPKNVCTIHAKPTLHCIPVNEDVRNWTTDARIPRVEIGINFDDFVFGITQPECQWSSSRRRTRCVGPSSLVGMASNRIKYETVSMTDGTMYFKWYRNPRKSTRWLDVDACGLPDLPKTNCNPLLQDHGTVHIKPHNRIGGGSERNEHQPIPRRCGWILRNEMTRSCRNSTNQYVHPIVRRYRCGYSNWRVRTHDLSA